MSANQSSSIDSLVAAGVEAAIAKFFARLSDNAGLLPVRQQWLRVPAASAYLSIDTVTLAKWRQDKIGTPCNRVGARVYYDIDVLDEFVRSNGAALIAEGKR